MEGIDPRTRQFTQPPERIKKEIAAAMADKRMSEEDRKELLDELNEALESAQEVQIPGKYPAGDQILQPHLRGDAVTNGATARMRTDS